MCDNKKNHWSLFYLYSCRLSDNGEDTKVKGPNNLGAWNRLMANLLKYFRTELENQKPALLKQGYGWGWRVRVRVRVCKDEHEGVGEDNGEGEENKAGQWLAICVSAAVEYFQLKWPGFFFSLLCRRIKDALNNSLFWSFFFTPRACLTITRVFMQSYNPAIPRWDYLYGRGCRLACFVSERKRAFLLPCAIAWLGILVEVVDLEALPIIYNWPLQKLHNIP